VLVTLLNSDIIVAILHTFRDKIIIYYIFRTLRVVIIERDI